MKSLFSKEKWQQLFYTVSHRLTDSTGFATAKREASPLPSSWLSSSVCASR